MKTWLLKGIVICFLLGIFIGCGASNTVSMMEGSDPTQGGIYTQIENE